MRTRTRYGGISTVLRRALEGRIGPLNFLILLGSLSSLLLLYISLHVHAESIMTRIDESRKRCDMLRDEKTTLMAERNELSKAERILPLVERFGMVPGSADQVHRVACYEPGGQGDVVEIHWAGGAPAASGGTVPARLSESR
ncbi:MAG: hypothetical protein PHQ19_01595 [Candidatus Krumholzibacteria bacterium]|nr:hypothetical protein [Candidatus Krumholzibacteria bacterium]